MVVQHAENQGSFEAIYPWGGEGTRLDGNGTLHMDVVPSNPCPQYSNVLETFSELFSLQITKYNLRPERSVSTPISSHITGPHEGSC